MAEQFAEAGDFLFIDRLKGFGGDVAAGQAGAAGRDDHIDGGILDPAVNCSTSESLSSRMMRLSTTLWPAPVMRSTRVWPEVSFSSVRLSETVRTAILTERKSPIAVNFGHA